MFNKYLLTTDKNNKKSLYLYLDNKYEFSGNSNSDSNIYKKVYKYINDNKINYDGNRIDFVRDGIVLGHIDLSDYDYNNDRYVEVIDSYNNKLVDLNNSMSVIEKMKLNEYLVGVVSSEVPISFNYEAIKAISVIARTYAIKRLKYNLPIYNITSTQIYRDKNYLKKIWKDKYEEHYNKILNAIKETDNQVIMYDNDYIDVYYHLCSYGKTEDAINVLNGNYPYLVSVDSNDNINYINHKIVSNSYLSKLLDMDININTKVNILVKTIGNRIKYIKFDDKVFDGLVLSNRLGLDSNNFSVSIGDNNTIFTSYGFGHGLGLSKYGANIMAENGYNYLEILHHYYPYTYIKKALFN